MFQFKERLQLQVLRENYHNFKRGWDEKTIEICELKKKAQEALESYNVNRLKELNDDYLLAKKSKAVLKVRLDETYDLIIAILNQKDLSLIDYEFFVDGDYLCIQQHLCEPEISFLECYFQSEGYSSITLSELESKQGYKLIIMKEVPNFKGEQTTLIPFTIDQINEKIGWLTQIKIKEKLIKELNLEILND